VGIGGDNTFNAYEYGIDLDETTATWNNSDGTLGTLLSSVTFDTTTTGLEVTFGDTLAFRTALEDALADDGFLRLLLANADETVGVHNFADLPTRQPR